MTVSGGDLASLNGTVGLDLAGGQDITDLAGNALPAGEPATDETYVLDNMAPTLVSFTRQDPTDEQTTADELTFRATFDEAVANVGTELRSKWNHSDCIFRRDGGCDDLRRHDLRR